MNKYVTYGGIRPIANWTKLHRCCYFCNTNQSVKYAMSTLNPASGRLGCIFICNKCAMRVIQKELASNRIKEEKEE